MARPIWTGTLSFGLLNVPISLMSGERRTDLHFKMLDSRNKQPIRYERVNAETGEEVPWKDIVKAFEYDKGSYVVLEEEDLKAAAPESKESIDINAFVHVDEIAPPFFEKPYFLVPGKKAEKGYVLLRETLRKTKRVGIGHVVIRTREYLCAVMPQGDALVMNLLRYPQELVDPEEYNFPAESTKSYRISGAEFEMAEKLIETMASEWKPGDYKDEFRERLTKVIKSRMKSKGVVKSLPEEDKLPEDATTNVVDFMALLQKSVASNKRTPAKKSATKSKAKKPAAQAVVSKKSAAKKKSATATKSRKAS
ncbi:MAG: Ku protein [Dokdonella sp.]